MSVHSCMTYFPSFSFSFLCIIAETNMNWNWTSRDFGKSSVHPVRKRYLPYGFFSNLFCAT